MAEAEESNGLVVGRVGSKQIPHGAKGEGSELAIAGGAGEGPCGIV